MAKGFAGALSAPQQQQQGPNPQQAPQALQQLQQMLRVVSGVHNEHTYQAAKQQFAQMGGDPSKLTKNYNKTEVDNFKKVLIKGMNHLVGMAPQQQQPQQSQAPMQQPPTTPPVQSSAPAPQED